jgi:chitinase
LILTAAVPAGGDNDIVRYFWEFGDSATGEGKYVSHTYNGTGEYKVYLTVTDRKGLTNRTSVKVKINQDPNANTPAGGPHQWAFYGQSRRYR